ncbi:MAG: four helix bundle protein [Chloroflexota bacterium]|nr:four helix bundle protein [Chloroflexota bacterium]
MKSAENSPGYRQLRAWQKADDLACAIFQLGESVPTSPRWLVSQVTRAAISTPANIAEGYSRGSLREYLHHLSIARGSLAETEYYLHFMQKTGIIDSSAYSWLGSLYGETASLLYALIRSLSKKLETEGGQRPYAIREAEAFYDCDSQTIPDP